jgi:hypothetical protein
MLGVAKGQVCQIPSGKLEESNDHSTTMAAALTIIILFSKMLGFSPKRISKNKML